MKKYFVETHHCNTIVFTSKEDLLSHLADIPPCDWPHTITMIEDGTAITLKPRIALDVC